MKTWLAGLGLASILSLSSLAKQPKTRKITVDKVTYIVATDNARTTISANMAPRIKTMIDEGNNSTLDFVLTETYTIMPPRHYIFRTLPSPEDRKLFEKINCRLNEGYY